MKPVRTLLLACVLSASLYAQTPEAALREQTDLNRAVGESQNSPVDLIRALEAHLVKYPESLNRAVIEKSLSQSAAQAGDSARIVLYGEKILAQAPEDLQLLDRVMRELAERTDTESTTRAAAYAKRYQAGIALLRNQPQPHVTPGQWSEQLDRATARAFALEAHAWGNAEKYAAALLSAQKSWTVYPTGEGAREAGNWLVKLGRTREAVDSYANAFTLEDPGSTEADRSRDRIRMGDLYTKLTGSEKGLGDIILQAYDRTSRLMKDRLAALKVVDPNAQAVDVADFSLPSGDGAAPLAISTLKGKTVVMDFWATWCIPCRAQHPLIEQVKKHYANSPDVVFLAVDTDDDPSVVAPFMKEQGWTEPVWLEGGLQRRLAISSIPTVLVLDPAGHVSSRIAGMIPERFEEMLIERIEGARSAAPR